MKRCPLDLGAVALVAATLLGGCKPDLGAPQSLVVGPRVLAVRGTPPEASLSADVSYDDIPPPFNVLDTGNVEDSARLIEAVKALLAQPAVKPGRLFLVRAKTRI